MKLDYKLLLIFLGFFIFNGCKKKMDPDLGLTLQSDQKWIQLFNGKNLEGWTPKIKGYKLGENIFNTFRVEDGVLKVSYDEYDNIFNDRFGHLFYKTPFSNYRLKLQYRFTGDQIKDGAGWAERNSGVMIHSQSPESMSLEQHFPMSIEVQMLGGIVEGESRPTANLCTPGTNVEINGKLITNHCTTSTSETIYGDQWVTLEVEVFSDSLIIHTINNNEVLRYSKPQIGGADLAAYNAAYKDSIGNFIKGGYISLQSESHPIEFRQIELLELNY